MIFSGEGGANRQFAMVIAYRDNSKAEQSFHKVFSGSLGVTI
jgi:hypothetical protein